MFKMSYWQYFVILILVFENFIKLTKAWEGFPYVGNCYKKNETLVMHPNDEYSVLPFWSHTDEQKKKPLERYNFHYKWVNEETKTELDVKKFITSYQGSNILRFDKYSVKPGSYFVNVTATLKDPNEDLPHMKEMVCYFDYVALSPIANIVGGSSRIVSSHNELELNGAHSVDPNLKQSTVEDLKFEWTCSQTVKVPMFCTNGAISTESNLRIPSEFMVESQKFEVTLTVLSQFKTTANTVQIIHVKGAAAEIEILCGKNCLPVTDVLNYFHPTFLHAKCVLNCLSILPNHYEWTIQREPIENNENFQFDYEKNTEFGRNGMKFLILKNVLQPGKYVVTVTLKNTAPRLGEASFNLNFIAPPIISGCKVTPSVGESMVTFFRLNCEQGKRQRNHYEFVAAEKKDPSKELISMDDYYPRAFEMEFVLPVSRMYDFFVRVSFQNGPHIELKIDMEVYESKMSTTEDFDKFYKGSIQELLTSTHTKNTEKGISKFQALVDHLVTTNSNDSNITDFIENLKYNAALDLLNTKITSLSEIDRIGQSITKLMNKNAPTDSDPQLAKLSTTLCRKMIEKHMEFVKKERSPLSLDEKSREVSNNLNKCLETNTNPNFGVIAPIEYNISTEIPTINEIVITENYDNYIDYQEDYYKHIQNLKEATYNIVKSSSIAAKITAMTTAPGEKFIEVVGEQSLTMVAKDEGRILFKSDITSQGVVLLPPKDFLNDDHYYDILMSVWSKDIFWWNRRHLPVSTNIVNVEFWHSTCKERITTFEEPAYLIFTIKNQSHFVVDYTQDTFLVPEKYESLSWEELNRVIKVRRIELAKGQNLRVEFSKAPKEQILEIVLTNFRFPTVEDFANSTIITEANNVVQFQNKNDFNIWCFMGVLANRQFVARKSIESIDYNFSAVVTNCIHWVESQNSWELYCKVLKHGAERESVIRSVYEFKKN